MENLIKDMVEDDERKPLADGGIYLVTEYLLHNEEGDSLTLFFNTIWNVLLEWDEEQTDTDEQVAKDAQDKFVKLDAATAMFFKHVEKFKPDILEVLSENLEGDEIQKVRRKQGAKRRAAERSEAAVAHLYFPFIFPISRLSSYTARFAHRSPPSHRLRRPR